MEHLQQPFVYKDHSQKYLASTLSSVAFGFPFLLNDFFQLVVKHSELSLDNLSKY